MKRLFKGGKVVSGHKCQELDLLIEDEKIIKAAHNIICTDAEIIDVTGKYLFPGFIDAHTHFNLEVSSTVTADDFHTGTKAALAGGTTMILDFATQYKGETLTEAIHNWHKKADGKCSCDYGFHLAISDWNKAVGSELEDVVSNGITSFKLYMTYDDMIVNDKEIYQILKRLKEFGGIAGVHCENQGIIKALVEEEKAKGHLSASAHPRTRPALAEAEAVSRLLKIAAIVDTPVIVVHLTSSEALEEILHVRKKGQSVFAETCPQYLLLDESKYELDERESRKYIISPPLRTVTDRNILWNALGMDEIQTIATDHCSFTEKQKAAGTDDFTKIPNGMPGTQTRPVIMYTYGVNENKISIEQMCRLLSENPAKLYGLYPQKGCLKAGSDADIVVWDKETIWKLSIENQLANTDYCPYEGLAVQGRAEKVYLRGQLAAENGHVLMEKSGHYIPRNLPAKEALNG